MVMEVMMMELMMMIEMIFKSVVVFILNHV